jgi:DNA repair exonuclease SbcCD ATPase subunit
MELSVIKHKLSERMTLYDQACANVKTEREALFEIEDKLACSEESRKVFQDVSKAVQQAAHNKIASVVSRCLEAVFDDPYEFQIKFDTKRGRTEARLVFIRDGIEVDPVSASGGGVVDVASFALRLACLSLSRPPLRKLMVLDEPFKFVSENYREQIRSLLKILSKEMEFQFLFVTHIPDLQCGKVITIS